jgi:hypothetical protein
LIGTKLSGDDAQGCFGYLWPVRSLGIQYPVGLQYKKNKECESMYREVDDVLESLKNKLEELRRYL